MLGLSRKTDYALLIVTALAGREGEFVSVRSLAGEYHLPYRFAAEVVGLLTRAGILEAKEGVRGGYRLAKAPTEISVAEVVEATEGRATLVRCLDPRTHGSCPQKVWCTAKEGMGVLQGRLLEELRRMTVADFTRAHARD